MVKRLLFLLLCGVPMNPVAAQLNNRHTSQWGGMPSGWINHGALPGNRTAFGVAQNRFGRGRYPVFVNPGYFSTGVYGGGIHSPIYRCVRCLNPYCFDPWCQGVAFGGLSLTVISPQILAVPRETSPIVVGPAPRTAITGEAELTAAELERTGLPWLDRLRRQQAIAFGARQANVVEERENAFHSKLKASLEAAIDSDSASVIRKKVAELKPSNEAGRRRSDQLIAEADKFFSDQHFKKAAQKYRQAIAVAPNYPKALFRAGHYFMAIGDYENSLLAYLMALEISKDIRQVGFHLNELYRGNLLDKMTHIDRLSNEASARPNDGGLLMLVGLTLFYDQQPERSLEFFRQAARLEGPQSVYADWYIRSLGRP